MKKISLSFLFIAFNMLIMNAQNYSIKLWGDDPVLSKDLTSINESAPELFVYLPDKATNTGKAVVICPGGGYSHLAMDHEGKEIAHWLAKQGIAGIVLKYRMPNGRKNVPLQDIQQAFMIVHKRAKEWGINENKIGVAGFSAGGHLASTASTHFVSFETRPAFSILFYPVITMEEFFTHMGSRKNLLGEKPSVTDIYTFANENQVTATTPPTILLLSDDDGAVVPENSIKYYEALKRNGVPAAMYIFPEGGHGWGMRSNFKYHSQMLSVLEVWLKDICND